MPSNLKKKKKKKNWIKFCARSWKAEKVTILPWQGRILTTMTEIFWDSDTASMFWPAPIQAWFPSQSCIPRTRHCSNKKTASNQNCLRKLSSVGKVRSKNTWPNASSLLSRHSTGKVLQMLTPVVFLPPWISPFFLLFFGGGGGGGECFENGEHHLLRKWQLVLWAGSTTH